jgi:hypothetical protein
MKQLYEIKIAPVVFGRLLKSGLKGTDTIDAIMTKTSPEKLLAIEGVGPFTIHTLLLEIIKEESIKSWPLGWALAIHQYQKTADYRRRNQKYNITKQF